MALGGSNEENIIIDGILLNGVQNVSFSQSVSEDVVSILGGNFVGTNITGPTATTVSIDKLLLNSDYVTGLTGSHNISGQFQYGTNNLNFEQACINSYAVSAAVNQLPEISFDLSIYGNISGNENSVVSSALKEDLIEKVSQQGLIVTFDKTPTNSVQSFSFSETFNVQPLYSLGEKIPSQISTVGPIVQEVTINIEVEDYEFENNFSFLSGSKDRNRNIKLEISGENGILNAFEMVNGILINEQMVAGVSNTMVASLTYRGYKDN